MKKPFSTKRGANVPLTGHGAKGPGQKGYLSQLAKEAFRFLTAKGAIEGEKETEFRHRESIEACGRRISEAVNGDFELIEARFLMLMGRTKRAFDSAVKADTNDERQARYKLAQLCAKRGIAVPALEGASVKRIWAVFFNIKTQPKRQAAKTTKPSGIDLQAELSQAVKEERYEDTAKLKAAISALQSQPAESADDDIPF